MLRTTWRRSFRERESGIESSTVRAAMAISECESGDRLAGCRLG
jgi:hypothetical protein